MSPHPKIRLLATIISLFSVFMTEDGIILFYIWLLLGLPLLVFTKIWKKYLYFSLVFWLPFSILIYFIWVVIVGAPPVSIFSTSIQSVENYVLLIIFRFALIAIIFQLCFLTLKTSELIFTFSMWGFKGNLFIVILSTLALITELNRRMEQVLTARYARGFFKKRSLWNNILNIPFLIRTLFTWTLRSSIQRSKIWNNKRLLTQLSTFPIRKQGTFIGSLFWLFLSLCIFFMTQIGL